MSSIPAPIPATRIAELLSALDSGDDAGYLAGFEIGDDDVQLERGELRELLNHYAADARGDVT